MKVFGARNTSASKDADVAADPIERKLQEIVDRLERIEDVIADLKPNIKMLPAIVRKLYLNDVELPPPYDLLAERFRYRSQNEEDGLVLALFKRIGMTDRRAVEIGCGMNGGNSGFLVQECGWSSLMVDAKWACIERVQVRYAGHPVTAVKRRVTRETVNALLNEHGYTGELDLLSIDIDGVDYWVWEAVTACQPRVVVIEYNWLFGADRAVTVPYNAEFDLAEMATRGYRGASLGALVHLASRKGYRLVATERVNAFFLRNDIAPDIQAITVQQGYRTASNAHPKRDAFSKIEATGLPLVTVTESGTAE